MRTWFSNLSVAIRSSVIAVVVVQTGLIFTPPSTSYDADMVQALLTSTIEIGNGWALVVRFIAPKG